MSIIQKSNRKAIHKAKDPILETPHAESSGDATERPIWEIVVDLGAQISDEDWSEIPDNSSINFRHYLYGAPAKQT